MLLKRSPLDKRLERIETELSALRKGLAFEDGKSASAPAADRVRDEHRSPPVAPAKSFAHNERLAEQLASRFLDARFERRDKRIQRNKAVAMATFVAIVFLWALYRMAKM